MFRELEKVLTPVCTISACRFCQANIIRPGEQDRCLQLLDLVLFATVSFSMLIYYLQSIARSLKVTNSLLRLQLQTVSTRNWISSWCISVHLTDPWFTIRTLSETGWGLWISYNLISPAVYFITLIKSPVAGEDRRQEESISVSCRYCVYKLSSLQIQENVSGPFQAAEQWRPKLCTHNI